MSLLMNRPALRRRSAAVQPPQRMTRGEAARYGAGGALVSAALSWAVAVLSIAPGWFAGTWESVVQILHFSGVLWMMAHGADLRVPGGEVSLPPLGFSLICGVIVWWEMRRRGRALVRRFPQRTQAQRAVPITTQAAFIGTYLVLPLIFRLVLGPGTPRVVLGGGLWVLAVIAGAGVIWGAWAATHRAFRAELKASLPAIPARAWRVAMWGLRGSLALLAISALGLVVACVLRAGVITDLHQGVSAGVGGSISLVLLQLWYLPDLAIWAGSVLVGPGFSFGIGTSITAQAVSVGTLPTFPIVGAVPPKGVWPAGAELLLLVPVLCGAYIGRQAARWGRGTLIVLATDLAGACVVAGVLVGGATGLAQGSLGPGRMALVGADPWLVGPIFMVQALIGAWAVLGAWWVRVGIRA